MSLALGFSPRANAAPRRDPRLPLDATHLPRLLDDLDEALTGFLEPLDARPTIWNQGPAGKWTAGQVVEHVGIALHVFIDRFEAIEKLARLGRADRRPWRDPIQALFLRVVVRDGRMPRGARSAAVLEPGELPRRDETLSRLTLDRERTRVLGMRLSPDEADRLWIHNPIVPAWHYTFPEAVRVQAVHARHHRRQLSAIAAVT